MAPNPGPMTLQGTNTYVVGGDPCYVIDPGPDDAGHAEVVRSEAKRRGGIGGVLLTHSHADHAAGAGLLDAPVIWGEIATPRQEGTPRQAGPVPSAEARVGPFTVVPTPGHARDHVCFVTERACFTGDLILGEGSSYVPPDGGSLAAYMDSLRRVGELDLELLCPGHGPFVTEPQAKIAEYAEHRLDRERKLVRALEAGERSRARLLEAAWDDVPAELRPAAAQVMQAHLEKLEVEGRLAGGLTE